MGGTDLSLVSTDDLIAEIRRRHAATLVVVERTAKTGMRTETLTEYWGGLTTCIGLASRAHNRLLRIATGELPEPDNTNKGDNE